MLNFKTLCAPISKREPSGADLRADTSSNSRYYQIKDARNSARVIERQKMQGVIENDANNDWDKVYQQGIEILTNHSKDLEITGWLIEALLRKHGFRGLAEGFKLAKMLAEQYWDSLFPQPDEDGMLARVATFRGLNGVEGDGTLIIPIATTPLTQGQSIEPLSLWQYQQATQGNAAANVTMEDFKVAVAETSTEFFKSLTTDLTECRNEFENLVACLDSKCGNEEIPSSNIRNKLTECLDCVNALAKTESESAAVIQVEMDNDEPSIIDFKFKGKHKMKNREEALKTLLTIASFFRSTEPHSPIPYLLERAVQWGNLPLDKLLEELISDETARGYAYKLTGIKKPENAS